MYLKLCYYMEVTTNMYFKSLNLIEGDLVTMKQGQESSKRIYQALGNMIDKGIVKANTKHGQLKDRLCVSVITNSYNGSYRPEGILFRADREPDYCSPVDLMALTNGKTFTASDYNSKFFGRSKELVFGSVESMLFAYGSPNEAHKKLVEIRDSYGLESPKNPFLYNECCFEGDVKITLVGLVGKSDAIAEAARKSGLVVYPTMKTFIKYNSDKLPRVDYSVSLKSGSNDVLMRHMKEKGRMWDAILSGLPNPKR